MKKHGFFGILMIVLGAMVLITGKAQWVHRAWLVDLTGFKLYLLSIPFILFGLYILYHSFISEKN